jgi:hypothetical protein
MIHKLKYTNKEEALQDLKSKGVIDDEDNYINGTESVVDCGVITLVYATEKEEAIYAEGYHYDIMTNDIIVFESEIIVNNPKYTFAGH